MVLGGYGPGYTELKEVEVVRHHSTCRGVIRSVVVEVAEVVVVVMVVLVVVADPPRFNSTTESLFHIPLIHTTEVTVNLNFGCIYYKWCITTALD